MAERHSTKAALIPAVAYYRMSTDKQDASIARQRSAVTKYASANGYQIVNEYADEGVSGAATEERHGFLRMMDACSSGRWGTILCDDMARFGRENSIRAGKYAWPIEEYHILITSIADGTIDLRTAEGRRAFGFESESNHAFLLKGARATVNAKQEKALLGKYFAIVPFGYSRSADEKIAPNEFAFAVKLAYEMYSAGHSTRAIGRKLYSDGITTKLGNPLPANHIKKILKNPVYVGHYQWNIDQSQRKFAEHQEPVHIDHNHPPIVSQSLFDKVQARFERNRARTSPGPKRTYTFSSLLNCSCGGRLYPTNRPKRQMYYRCKGRDYGPSECQRARVEAAIIEPAIISALSETFREERSLARLRKSLYAELKRREKDARIAPGDAEKRVRSARAKLRSLEERLRLVDPDMMTIIMDGIRAKRAELRKAENDVQAARMADGQLTPEDLEERLQHAVGRMAELPDILSAMEPADRNRVLSTLIERVDVRTKVLPLRNPKSRPQHVLTGGTIHLAAPFGRELSPLSPR